MLRRLYLQIYLTIIASLILLAVISGLVWELFGSDRANQYFFDAASQIASLAIPESTAPVEEQRAAIVRLGKALNFDIALFSESGEVIARFGKPKRPIWRHKDRGGRHRGHRGSAFTLVLSDGRWLLVDPRDDKSFSRFFYFLLVLGVVALCIGIAAYPLTRRMTKRLEKLQHGVERMGAGDLGTRVDIKGRDEVAQLAKSFNESAEKIERLVNAHRLLLANASHELRTPLSRIRLGLELENVEQTPERRAALKQDIAELDMLIDEILLMSRLDADAQVNLTQTVDLVALAAEECARIDNCELHGSAPEIYGDSRLLHRMLKNLVENASKYGKPPFEIVLDSDAVNATISVIDCGEGINEADREKVFQPFFRGAGNQNVTGYGLGLALVRQIVEVHGGVVEIAPKQEEKFTIKVSLPIKPESRNSA